ncbi:MAG: TonB-dependent receptor [Nitrospira sp.]
MSRIRVKHHRRRNADQVILARVQTALERAADITHRSGLSWRVLMSVSSLALGLYHPAMAQDEPWRDRSLVPRQPESGFRPFGDVPGRSNGSDESARVWTSTPYRIAMQDGDGPPTHHFEIPAGELQAALTAFSRQTEVQLLYLSDLVSSLQTSGLHGDYTVDDALRILLKGTGLEHRFSDHKTVVVQRAGRAEEIGSPHLASAEGDGNKPIKVPEVVVKDVRERPTWTTPVDGYKADHASTITRNTMSIDETPVSIGVVTRDMIRDTFARSQMDAFESVSGMTRSTTYGRGETFSIRGLASNNRVGSFNAMRGNGLPIDGIWAPDWGIVERYEVVKGPASIVGGAASPGGLINRITKTPQRHNFTTTEFQAGSYGLLRGMIDVNGVLPINDNVRGRMVVAVEDGGNFVDNTPVRQYTVAPSVEFDLFKGAGKLLVLGMYQRFDGAIYPGYPLRSDGTMLEIARTRNFGGGAANGARTTYTGYSGELHYDHRFIHDIKLSVKGKYSNSYLHDKTIYSYAPGGIPLNGDSYFNSGLQKNRFDTYAGELFLSKEFNLWEQKHEILAGADYRDMSQNYLNGYIYLPAGGTPVLDNVFNPRNLVQAPGGDQPYIDAAIAAGGSNFNRQQLKQVGAFAQAVVRPTQRLTLVFAGRHDRADQQLLNKVTGENDEFMRQAWTGRFGATYKVTQWMNIYGGIQQSFIPQFGRTSAGQVLKPETGINYEIGAKLNMLEERLRITTALFRTYRENVSVIDPTNNRFQMTVGEQRHQGVEFDVNGQPMPGLNLNINFAYLDAEITKDTRPEFIGQRANSPNYVGRVFGTYQIQSGTLQGFGFGGGVYFIGDYDLLLPNRVKVDPYERVDAVVFYRGSQRWDVSINVRNLLNARYIENPGTINWANRFGAPVSAFGSVRVYF